MEAHEAPVRSILGAKRGISLVGMQAGDVIGALPAIGPIGGIALLLPIADTMGLPPESTTILLAGICLGAGHGGRIAAGSDATQPFLSQDPTEQLSA